MSKKPTKRQLEICSFIEDHFSRHSTSPTLAEIAKAFGISEPGVWYHIRALERKGLVRTDRRGARTIFLTQWSDHAPSITLIPLYEETEYLECKVRKRGDFNASALSLKSGHEYFCIHMQSANLVNAGIRQGDYLVMKRQSEAVEGDLVLASLEGGETMHLRTYHPVGGKIILQAECDSMGNISCQSCTVHAIVHAMVRIYG